MCRALNQLIDNFIMKNVAGAIIARNVQRIPAEFIACGMFKWFKCCMRLSTVVRY